MSAIPPVTESASANSSDAAPSARSSRMRHYLLSALLLVGLTGIAYWVAHWECPAGGASGTEFQGTAQPGSGLPRRFKVATFNIHGGYGLDGRLDLSRTAGCLKSLDFAGLNEVRGGGINGTGSQAEQLGGLLNMAWLFAPTESGWSGPQFGQGALSRYPVTKWEVVPFPRKVGNGYRNYVECQIPFTPSTSDSASESSHRPSLTILVTHLDRKSDRQDQLRSLIQHFLELPAPVILMGDLNAKRTEPQLIELAKQVGVIECFGKFAAEPLVSKRIDWIFVRGLNCRNANLEATDASDHPWGWAELELEE